MFLSISTRAGGGLDRADDLGFLLHKHPERVHDRHVAGGRVQVFYPTADEHECTVAVLLEVDPIALVRGRKGAAAEAFALGRYVNDRPYAASSLLAVALNGVFSTAMAGRCAIRPELPERRLALRVHLPAVPCRGGGDLVERLFGPLGWTVRSIPVPLDPTRPDWGDSRYLDLTLTGELTVADALGQLYVLLPVLDDAKHYAVGADEVDKLLRTGSRWLAGHPESELISRRYLSHRKELVRTAVGRLAEVDDTEPEALDNAVPADDDVAAPDDGTTAAMEVDPAPAQEPRVPLARMRHEAVLAALREVGARRVVDLGCGPGSLLRQLLADPVFTEIVGADVSVRALEMAARKLRLDRLPERRRGRLQLLQSSLMYTDSRLTGYDAAVLMEVIEHVEAARLPALEHSVFGAARPAAVVVTTPNAEHNVRYETLPAGSFRHPDHRFEWTREQFGAWAGRVAASHGYTLAIRGVGPDDAEVGPPTQLALFRRADVTDRTEGAA